MSLDRAFALHDDLATQGIFTGPNFIFFSFMVPSCEVGGKVPTPWQAVWCTSRLSQLAFNLAASVIKRNFVLLVFKMFPVIDVARNDFKKL